MTDFDDMIHQKPCDIRAVFVSDLHLSAFTTTFNQAFVALIDKLSSLPNLDKFFILGDFLDSWLGDDDVVNQSWLLPVLDKLQLLSKKTKIYVMRGNRDFMICQKFCNRFFGILIDTPFYLDNAVRLEHGDRLCTDDKSYQCYRKLIQNQLSLFVLRRLPLDVRLSLKGNIKKQAHNQKIHKPAHITDVNNNAVKKAMKKVSVLIHGHTHRPFVHQYNITRYNTKKRIVLGDWRFVDLDSTNDLNSRHLDDSLNNSLGNSDLDKNSSYNLKKCSNQMVTAEILIMLNKNNSHRNDERFILCSFNYMTSR